MDTHSALAGDLSGVPESPVVGDSSRALLARRTRYPKGHHIQPHWHSRAQFLFAVEGTMRVRTPRHVWIVPPSRALWLPARTAHELQMDGVVEMRSFYLNDAAAAGMLPPAWCSTSRRSCASWWYARSRCPSATTRTDPRAWSRAC